MATGAAGTEAPAGASQERLKVLFCGRTMLDGATPLAAMRRCAPAGPAPAPAPPLRASRPTTTPDAAFNFTAARLAPAEFDVVVCDKADVASAAEDAHMLARHSARSASPAQ